MIASSSPNASQIRLFRAFTSLHNTFPNNRLCHIKLAPSCPQTTITKPPKATLKPPQSVLIANRLRPQSHPKATPKPHKAPTKPAASRMSDMVAGFARAFGRWAGLRGPGGACRARGGAEVEIARSFGFCLGPVLGSC